jgi:sec-independent protein translocase protein TatB
LPTAASWLAKTIRQIKNYATDANQKIRSELGPEFDEIREPLNDLRTDWTNLRTWRDPRAVLIHHLRDDPITPHPSSTPIEQQPATTPEPAGSQSTTTSPRAENTHPSTPTQPDIQKATGRAPVPLPHGRIVLAKPDAGLITSDYQKPLPDSAGHGWTFPLTSPDACGWCVLVPGIGSCSG